MVTTLDIHAFECEIQAFNPVEPFRNLRNLTIYCRKMMNEDYFFHQLTHLAYLTKLDSVRALKKENREMGKTCKV